VWGLGNSPTFILIALEMAGACSAIRWRTRMSRFLTLRFKSRVAGAHEQAGRRDLLGPRAWLSSAEQGGWPTPMRKVAGRGSRPKKTLLAWARAKFVAGAGPNPQTRPQGRPQRTPHRRPSDGSRSLIQYRTRQFAGTEACAPLPCAAVIGSITRTSPMAATHPITSHQGLRIRQGP